MEESMEYTPNKNLFGFDGGGGRTFIAMVSAVQYSLHLHLHKHEMLLFTIPGMLWKPEF